MEPTESGFTRQESGLWLPDLKTDGLKALTQEDVNGIDPSEYARKNCKFCHGSGEMRRVTGKGTFKWVICLCVVKNFPRGKENTEKLLNTDFEIQERKNKGVLK